MNVKDILAKSGITQHELAVLAGIPRDRIAKWVQGKGSPKAEDTKKLEAFILKYSGTSSRELKAIVADIERSKTVIAATEIIKDTTEPTPTRPTGDQIRARKAFGEEDKRKVVVLGEAGASTNLEMDTPTPLAGQYIDVGDLLRDSEAAFTVYGNSMTPAYPSGCVLGLKRNYDGFIQPGETYVIETRSNRVFKRLYWNKDKTAYECYSDNKMIEDTGERAGKFFYEMFEVKLEEVIRLFDVTGMIKRNRNSGIMEKG